MKTPRRTKMPASYLKQITILYVEDDLLIREEIEDILEGSCLKLYSAKDGKEGLGLYEKYAPDIVITDIRMPIMNGLSMSRAILDINPNAAIVVMSAFNDSEYLLQAITLGIHRYLVKPVNVNDLFTQLEQISKIIVQAKQLKKSEILLSQYKIAVDKSSIVSQCDADGAITYVNEAFCSISGFSQAELIGSNHSIIKDPKTKPEIFVEFYATLAAKKEWHGKFYNKAKDGKRFIVEMTVIPILNNNDVIESYLSISKDVTQTEEEKEQLTDALQISTDDLVKKKHFIVEYEKALKQSTLFCRTTQTGVITTVSQAFVTLLGIKESDIVGKPYFELVEPSFVSKLDTEVRTAIQEHRFWQGLITHRNAKGEELFLESYFIPIMDMHDEVDEVLCFYTDTTKQVHLNRDILITQREVIATMGAIGETRSKETGDHVKRVAEYSKCLALKWGLSLKEAEEIKMASPMHDIGKVGIPDNILNKPGKLDFDEFEIMKTHAMLGFEMLDGSNQPLLKTAAMIAQTHHEKWNGSGYPYGLKGEAIPIHGRITAIADVFDALGHDRVYKKAWPLEDILDLFTQESGKHFDPHLIDLFMTNLDEFLAIQHSFDEV